MNVLTNKQRRIVSIAANTAIGNVDSLTSELDAGLNSELTEAEIKDILRQVSSHCGFSTTLQGIIIFETLLECRTAKGIASKSDLRVIRDMDEFIKVKYTKGYSEDHCRCVSNLHNIRYLEERGYAYTVDDNTLNYQERELVNISVLAAMTGEDAHLCDHINMGLRMGLDIGILSDVMFVIGDICPERELIASGILFHSADNKTV